MVGTRSPNCRFPVEFAGLVTYRGMEESTRSMQNRETGEYRQWLGSGPHLVALATPAPASNTGYKPDRR
jgi:hypothetical protein